MTTHNQKTINEIYKMIKQLQNKWEIFRISPCLDPSNKNKISLYSYYNENKTNKTIRIINRPDYIYWFLSGYEFIS